jgi:hypothetical protein
VSLLFLAWFACSEAKPASHDLPANDRASVEPAAETSAPEAASPEPAVEANPAEPDSDAQVIARRVGELPAVDGRLEDPAWSHGVPVPLDRDWRGDPVQIETSARFVWNSEALCFAFEAGYDELVVDDAPIEIEHSHLYDFDAVEVFLDDTPDSIETYRELELGPAGHYLDLDVDRSARPRGDPAWSSGMRHATSIDETGKRFVVEACVPASAFETALSPGEWRLALYRVLGRGADRKYLARFPTLTERPSFHVPERFGVLRLAE